MLRLDDYYFLLHAFDRLGRHLYGDDWTGGEYGEPRIDSPEELARKRAPLERRLAELDARQNGIMDAIRRTTDEAEIERLRSEQAQLIDERTPLRERLLTTAQPDESYRRQYAAYERRRRTEEVLFEALKTEAIHAQLGRGMVIDWQLWSRDRGFKVYLDLSLVLMPRTATSLRRATALIRRKDFDQWLKTVVPEAPGEVAKMSPDDQGRAWLRDYIRKAAGKKPAAKPRLRKDAMRDIPRLSARGFDRIWDEIAPAHWKEGGAPTGPRPRKIKAPPPQKRVGFPRHS